MTTYDDGGQPSKGINQQRNLEKSIESLLGISLGLVADNILNEDEIMFLRTWLLEHEDLIQVWPANVIAERVMDVLEDGIITAEEAEDLKTTLSQITGGYLEHGATAGVTTVLPEELNTTVNFRDHIFCFTGKFVYGTRSKCEESVIARGGSCTRDVSHSVNYLVVGGLASRDWIHTSYGRKIEKAMKYKDEGYSIAVLTEEDWLSCLGNEPNSAEKASEQILPTTI